MGKISRGVIGVDGVVAIGWVFVWRLLMAGCTRAVWFGSRRVARGQVGSVGRATGWNYHWHLFRRPRSHPVA